MTVATFAKGEPLSPVPDRPYPAELWVERTVSPQALPLRRCPACWMPPATRAPRPCLARLAAEAGRKAYFTTCEDVVRRLRRAVAEHCDRK